jgi:hypothetical protein
VDDTPTGTNSSPVRGYEVMTGIDVGENPFPTVAQASNFVWRRTIIAAERPWALVADERWFCLLVAFNGSVSADLSSRHALYQFGDPVGAAPTDAFCGYVTGHATPAPTNVFDATSQQLFNGAEDGQYFARNHLGSIGPVTVMRYGTSFNGVQGNTATYPSPYNNGDLLVGPATLHQNSGGVLRGLQPAFLQGLTDRATTVPSPLTHRIIDPSASLDRAVMLAACGDSGGNARVYVGLDIWGPWR